MAELITRVKKALVGGFQNYCDIHHANAELTLPTAKIGESRETYVNSISKNGPYVPCLEDNLVEGIVREDFEEDLKQGAGGELSIKKAKFFAVHSSAALVVNTFARFKKQPSALSLCGIDGFDCIQFEEKCGMWQRNKRPPNLDLVAKNKKYVVGVESKLTEYLSKHETHFSSQYGENISSGDCNAHWFRAMQRVEDDPSSYKHLNAPQLIKHAFGLHHTFPTEKIILLYLYWEPRDTSGHDTFDRHREEIKQFSKLVSGGRVGFESMSYPELWKQWKQQPRQPDWLKEHTRNLRDRYDVSL